MKRRSAAELRQLFLDFFARHDHTVVKSSPLVPANDPTLMFTNAGMVQFKDVFTGEQTVSYKRATSSQKCMRVSGKHNDLEEVGRTARHHTLFEMLGNFSFGDYFKEEAIRLAWTFLTEEVGLPTQRLWITVFGGEDGIPADDEARRIWREVTGFGDERILGMGSKENFWAMGDTGPCGPCTEIHYDTGGEGTPTEDDFETGRVVEIWNNVFMQFNRQADGELLALPAPSVDTGMGLERLATVVQGEDSNYHTDLFFPLIETIAAAVGKAYQRSDSEDDVSMRVIADHARATAFLVADGVQPSNEGRGYVMRRIMRRAIRHGRRLGFDDIFFDSMCLKVVDIMQEAYPELREARTLIEKVAQLEERTFRRTLDTGLGLLATELDRLEEDGERAVPGETVFKLYDTYGFPRDLTEVIASERGLSIDEEGFNREMEAQRERSRGAAVGEQAVDAAYKALKEKLGETRFIGYTHEDSPVDAREGTWRLRDDDGAQYLEAQTKVLAVLADGEEVESASDGSIELVLDPTPFYGEAGGQVGDEGLLVGNGDGLRVEITNTIKPLDDLTISRGRILAGTARPGTSVWAGYRPDVRKMTRAHHSATHLLHASLRGVLGEHVKQAGSLVDPDHLRFDYSHFEAPTREQLRAIEDDANERVASGARVQTDVLAFDEARERGAIALFGEKYGEVVRVITMGNSVELCGGTHVANTGDIGMVLITREEAVAAGVRRIEAEVGDAAARSVRATGERLARAAALLTGNDEEPGDDPILQAVAKAVRTYRELTEQLAEVGSAPEPLALAARAPEYGGRIELAAARRVRDLWAALVQLTNTKGADAIAAAQRHADIDTGILAAFAQLQQANREAERVLEKARSQQLTDSAGDLMDGLEDVGEVKVLATRVDGIDGKGLRELADQLRSRLSSGVLCLVSDNAGKAAMLVAVTKDLTQRFKAGALVKELAPLIGGRGGGKPELAQAGGSNAAGAPEAFERLRELIRAG